MNFASRLSREAGGLSIFSKIASILALLWLQNEPINQKSAAEPKFTAFAAACALAEDAESCPAVAKKDANVWQSRR